MSATRIVVSDPELAGSYELVERRSDGSILLRPVTERLSEVIAETADRVFVDDEFTAHLRRVAAADDDLPRDSV